MSQSAANRRGMIALTFGMAAYTVNDVFVKLVARDLPFGEVLFLRGVVSSLILLAVIAMTGGLRFIAASATPMVLLRALFDALGTGFFIAALINMKIADLSAVVMTTPLILTALAAVMLGDPVGWRRWSAIGVGLIGTLFIVKPGAGTLDWWALVGLAAAFFGAARDLTTRRIDPHILSLVVGFYGTIAVMASGAAIGVTETWIAPDGAQWTMITVASAFLGLGTYLMVFAFRGVEIPAVAPFRYTLLIWMGVAGYVAFGEVPDGWALFGAALIVFSGLYALHREAVARRQVAALGPPPA
ncbi:DMT family transporter [Pseudorhodoplanes sp.]|uniref:DMT family transporter n=1 Tax=Pseudorhodoplanes sp. TaxID=1934341 RepID=UPI00391D595D